MKAVRNNKTKYLLIGFLAVALLISFCVGALYPLAEDAECNCGQTDGTHAGTCALYTPTLASQAYATAVSSIYTTAEYVDTPTVLTDSGAIINWARGDIKYLSVNLSGLDGLAAGQHYRLVVTLDTAVYASNIPTYTDTWATSCTVDKNGNIPINKDGVYQVNANSAKVTYDINPNFSSGTLSMTLNYDWRLSDSREGTDLGFNNIYGTAAPLVRVELFVISGETTTVISDHNLKTAKSTVGISATSTIEYMVDNFSITAMNSSQTASIRLGLLNNTLVKNMLIEITLPTYVLDGVTYAMDFTEVNTIGVASGKANYTFEREVLSSGAIKGTFRFTDFLAYSAYAYLGVTMPFSEPALSSGSHTFSGGTVSISCSDGDNVFYKDKKMPNMMMTDANAPKVTLYKHANNYTVTNHGDNITFVGMFAVGNTGGINTGAITISENFETTGTNFIGVTSLKIMLPIGQTTTVYFTMEDRDGNPAFGGGEFSYELTNVSTAVKEGIVFSRAMLPEELRSYYFASITYVIDIPASTNLFAESYHQFNCGSIWGEIYPTSNARSYHNYAVYKGDFKDQGGFGEALIEWRQTLFIDSLNQTPYGIDKLSVSLPANNNKVNTVTVNPGEKINIHANLFIYDYPYSGDCDLDKIGFAILLPHGVSVLTGEILAKYTATGAAIDIASVTQREVTVGEGKQVLWDIRLDPSATVGYFSEMITAIDNGERVSIVIPIVSELTIPQQDIVLNSKLFVYGLGQPNSSKGGNVSNNATKDIYGLLGSGFSSSDLIGCSSNKSNATSIVISINHPSALLDISDRIYIEGKGTGIGTIYSNSENDRLVYRLDIECTRGGTADNFFYYVPIPRSSQNNNLDFFTNEYGISMVLASEVSVDAENAVIKIQYTTDGNLSYDNAAGAVWLDYADLTDLSAVTMIRIVTETGKVISNGANITVTVVCKYADELVFSSMAGTSFEWRSKGYYEYTIGNTTNAGDRLTVGGTVGIRYRTPEMTVTLTAAKNMEPTAPASRDVTISLYDFIGSTFKLSQNLTVKNIVTSSLTLVDATNQQFAQMTSSQSNTNFKLDIKLNNSSSKTLLAGSEVSLGNIAANSDKSSVNLVLSNGNVITENAIMRSVSFELVGNNGITVPVTVIIKRELSPAEPEVPSILAGKHYSLYDTVNDRVSVSTNSAFTVQYVLDLIPQNYESPVLYVEGISSGEIIMIDWTDVTAPKYYHASVGAEVPLSDFISLDTSERYFYNSSDSTERTHSLIFIFNMKEKPIEQGIEGHVSLVRKAKSGTSIEQTLYFNSVGKRTFESSTARVAKEGTAFSLDYTSSSSLDGASDYEFYNKALALVVQGRSLPQDLYVEAGGKKYYRNVSGKFIIPLSDDAQRSSGSIELTAVSSAMDESVYLTFEIWLCATIDATKPSSGTKLTQEQTVEIIPSFGNSAIKVLRISDKHISPDEVEKGITLLLERKNTDNIPVTLELQRKVARGYTTMSTLSTNIVGATVGDNGVYTVNSDQLLITLNPYSVEPGTYRILFKVYGIDGTVTEVVEGFIIGE